MTFDPRLGIKYGECATGADTATRPLCLVSRLDLGTHASNTHLRALIPICRDLHLKSRTRHVFGFPKVDILGII